jgi:predicted cation transporter
LSEETKILLKNAHISIAVSAAILIGVFIPFHDNEGAIEAATYAAFAIGLGLLIFLNSRIDKARNKPQRR